MQRPRILFPLVLTALVAPGTAGVDPVPGRPLEEDPTPRRAVSAPVQEPPSWAHQRALAADGSVAAAVWCLGAVEGAVRDPHERLATKRDLYRSLLDSRDGAALDVALVARIAGERDLPVDEAVDLARAIGGALQDPELQAAALAAEGRLVAERGGDRDAARELFELVRTAFPETDAGRGAEDELWRIDRMSVGREVPDFVTHDVAGNVIRLSDFRGRVVVVRFWTFDDARSSEALRRDRELVDELWDESFTLIGVNADRDRDAFRRRSERHELHWTQAYEGSADGPAIRAWRPRAWPSTYLVDAAGTLRAVDPRADELERLVRSILEEERAPATEEIDRNDQAAR